MMTPMQYLQTNGEKLRVRVFFSQSQVVGDLDGFTLSSDGLWINLSKAVKFSELAPAHMPAKRFDMYSINMDGARAVLEQ